MPFERARMESFGFALFPFCALQCRRPKGLMLSIERPLERSSELFELLGNEAAFISYTKPFHCLRA